MPKRRTLTPREKMLVIERQGSRCDCGCGETLVPGQIDFDHEIPLWTANDDADERRLNDLSNFRALVRRHHKIKSNADNTTRAKVERLRLKNRGEWLKPKDRALARMLGKTRQL